MTRVHTLRCIRYLRRLRCLICWGKGDCTEEISPDLPDDSDEHLQRIERCQRHSLSDKIAWRQVGSTVVGGVKMQSYGGCFKCWLPCYACTGRWKVRSCMPQGGSVGYNQVKEADCDFHKFLLRDALKAWISGHLDPGGSSSDWRWLHARMMEDLGSAPKTQGDEDRQVMAWLGSRWKTNNEEYCGLHRLMFLRAITLPS